MKFKHLSENIDLAKLKQMSSSFQVKEEAPLDKLSVKLYHGAACLILRITPGADGSIVLQQAIQKCGGVGHLDDFNLFLVINDQGIQIVFIAFLNAQAHISNNQPDADKKVVGEKLIPFDLISQAGAANCKLILEKTPSAVSECFPLTLHTPLYDAANPTP